MSRNPVRYLGDIRECPICGKEFVCPVFDDWVYQRNPTTGTGKNAKSIRLIFCSWSCLRAWDKEHEADLDRRRKKRRNAEP